MFGRLVGLDGGHGLVLVWIELLPDRVDLFDGELVESRVELLESELDALAQGLDGGLVRRQRRLQAVAHRQKFCGEALQRVFMSVGDVGLRTLADVVAFGFGAKPCIVVLLGLELGPFEHLRKTEHLFAPASGALLAAAAILARARHRPRSPATSPS